MKITIATAALALIALGGCEAREETGRTGAADTVVTTRQEADTAIITTDTTVDVDTTRREGDRPVSQDTVQR
ncbi:MAG TPA: hypothetical protein VEB59_11785 [Gemmatimonadales bacterium]|nr:hypothetical protein [Gemmatimonadales bacterium]